MALKLIAFNPSKRRKKSKTKRAKARTKKKRGLFGIARKRSRPPANSSPKRAKGSKMAKKKGRRRGKRRGFLSRFTANTSSPPASGRRRRSGGGGGAKGFSLKNALSVRTLTEGLIVGGAVVASNIATHKLVERFKPDLAKNPWLMSAAQVAIGVAGTAILRAIGQGKYASHFMTGATAGAAMNAYGAWQAQRQAENPQQVVAGMRGLAGMFGPMQSPGFAPTSPRVSLAS